MKKFARFAVAIGVAVLLASCTATQVSGTKMDSGNVSKIVKGKTTQMEVVSMFGQPAMTSMLLGGERMMVYNFSQTTARAKPQTAIPWVGRFVGGATGTTETQMLQVQIGSDGVVKDYVFNDQSRNIESTGVNRSSKPMASTSTGGGGPNATPQDAEKK